jgi:hypothetical protein
MLASLPLPMLSGTDMDNLPITLNLSVIEVNTLLQLLGETPTKMGLYPLAMKIKEQADAQVPAPAAE